ncbi:glucosamine-6-phosphate deaminase [Labrys wisconsinensis]|uniref:Glucosamine-6-phosphate deaminase n=1 Tax=Labrys wisconsinensis TaxID=425677 RepID=A0ABU0JHA1_9HYPH|nr:glucosamine-6-phosphate deaminase [Labrys wisconsinensis]MDQ0473662.1 glucosamine-6-phosphate deaminase [Labrys wisconsinensis]
MQFHWYEDPAALAGHAADRIAALLHRKPDAAIALPTGQTPLMLYRELAQRHRTGALSLAAAHLFNLDEYLGLPGRHPMSYAAFLRDNLIDLVDADPARVHLLDGASADPAAACAAHDRAVEAAGGLDLAILGLGVNGHIAFNEPGCSWQTRGHVVDLAEATLARHREQTGRGDLPKRGLTMGVATLREARSVLLLASGSGKRAAMAALLAGRGDPDWPVTSMLTHPDLLVLAEERLRRPLSPADGLRAAAG